MDARCSESVSTSVNGPVGTIGLARKQGSKAPLFANTHMEYHDAAGEQQPSALQARLHGRRASAGLWSRTPFRACRPRAPAQDGLERIAELQPLRSDALGGQPPACEGSTRQRMRQTAMLAHTASD
eukprot:6198601-Pleurochrysis_carterae.AAC.1